MSSKAVGASSHPKNGTRDEEENAHTPYHDEEPMVARFTVNGIRREMQDGRVNVDASPAEPMLEEPGLLQALWHFAWLVVTLTVLGALNAYAIAMQQPALYEATSTLLVADPTSVSYGSPPRQIGTDRYVTHQAQIVRSTPVLQRAAEISTVPIRPDELRGLVKAEPARNMDVLTITASHPLPEGSIALVSAVTKAYDEVLTERFSRSAQEAMAELDAIANNARRRLIEIQRELGGNPNNAVLMAEREAAANQLTEAESARQQLAISAQVYGSGVEVLQPAAGAAQVQPAPLRGTAFGAFIGFFLAAAIAWFLSLRQAQKHERFERSLGVPLLGEVPKFSRAREGFLPAMSAPESRPAAAYKYALSSLDLARDSTSRTILLTSIRGGEGKTVTCANLAAAASEGGRRVFLVDADCRKQQLTHLGGANSKPDTPMDGNRLPSQNGSIVRPWRPLDALEIPLVASTDWNGQTQTHAGSLRSLAVKEVFRHARLRSDLILVDSPPLLSLGDAVEVLPYVDGIVLVVTPKTPDDLLIAARRRLELIDRPVIGFILNRTDPRKAWHASAL